MKIPTLPHLPRLQLHAESRWTNKDLDPVPADQRKWTVLSFIGYWISDCFSVANWQLASSIIAIGLSWKDSLGMVALGFFILSIVISMNGVIGAIYHIPFPVIARASWGFWGSYIPIISRLILAVFWFATQVVNGGNSVAVMIGAIWPSFLDIPNTLPESEGITTQGIIGFFIFWLLQIPFLLVHPNKLRWLFLAKSVVVPAAWIAMLIWAFVSTSHTDILLAQKIKQTSRDIPASTLGGIYYMFFLLPAMFTFIAFIGIAVSSAGQVKYNTESIPWDPNVLVSLWSNRACQFFGAFSFALAALGSNISANSLAAANDFSALAPRFINIRRGQLLCALFAWPLVPWKILASAGNFLNFMVAYAIFLGPIAAIMLCDYWIVKRRKYDSVALYQPMGIYRYFHGFNHHALIAFIVGTVPSLPGLMNSVNSSIEIGVGVHPYEFGWLLGFVVSTMVYVGLNIVFPQTDAQIDTAIFPDTNLEGLELDGNGSKVAAKV
ncbi:Nucleobase cation symporter-1 NCS1 [Penicillium expansum]|nr:Nucleobase cation symporter-1 NCS1 [Penicillium expansum]